MNILKAVLLKLASAFLFALMSALVRYVGDVTPVGQIVFFRSAFAIIPVVLIYAWRRELMSAVRTSRPLRPSRARPDRRRAACSSISQRWRACRSWT